MRLTEKRQKAIEEINRAILRGVKGKRLDKKISKVCEENDVKETNIKRIIH